MPITRAYTACNVMETPNLKDMRPSWIPFHCRVKLQTAGDTTCSVTEALRSDTF